MSSQPCSTGVPAVSPPKPRGDSLPHHSGEEDADAAVSLTAAVYEGRSSGSRELRLLTGSRSIHAERSQGRFPALREERRLLLPAGSSAYSPKRAITEVPGSIHDAALSSGSTSRDAPAALGHLRGWIQREQCVTMGRSKLILC